jgi:hypothetical protein
MQSEFPQTIRSRNAFNINQPSTPRVPYGHFPSGIPILILLTYLICPVRATRLHSHFTLFVYCSNLWLRAQILNPTLFRFLQPSLTCFHLDENDRFSFFFSNILIDVFPLRRRSV